jgi:hypothetical protein
MAWLASLRIGFTSWRTVPLLFHHIVEKEHLRMVPTRFTEMNAPAVAIPWDMHRRLISPRLTAEQRM